MKYKLEFKKNRKRDLEPVKTGYYFRGIHLSRYLGESLDMLRDRIKGLNDEQKHQRDEWKVLHFYYDRQTDITKKIHTKKQDYYKKLSERSRFAKIFRLENRIEEIQDRKERIVRDFDDRIKEIKAEILNLKGK